MIALLGGPLALLTALVPAAPAGQSALQPEAPRAGGELALRYDPGSPRARFAATEDVHGVATFMTLRGPRSRAVRLARAQEVLTGSVRVPQDALYVYARFVTRADHDRAADLEEMVHDADGAPVRGARLRAAFAGGREPQEWIEEELQHHPDSWGAFRAKWFLSSLGSEPEVLRATVREDMGWIGEEETADALWARSYGSMLLGDEARARQLVLTALERHPASLSTARAVSDYQYQCYSQGVAGRGPAQVEASLAAAIERHPASWLARENVRVVSARDGFPLAATRAICSAWLEEEPGHPEPSLVLAEACARTGESLGEGARHASAALNLLLGGGFRLHGDAAGTLTEMLTPAACRVAAELALARGDQAAALGYARTLRLVCRTTDARGSELEARAWSGLGQLRLAEEAWARALDEGSRSGRDELRRMYRAATGTEAGFEVHLAALLDAQRAEGLPPAPGFAVHDLEGAGLSLDDLRGRVVVLNFWGLGCAPCKVEIPVLNRLVAAYRGEEVEFVAFANDAAEDLRRYLADHPFAYRVVAAAGAVAGRYEVRAWPTHVVIDRAGRIAGTLTGGSEDQDERLRPLIERALRR